MKQGILEFVTFFAVTRRLSPDPGFPKRVARIAVKLSRSDSLIVAVGLNPRLR